jgi:Uma2 family endonuclease
MTPTTVVSKWENIVSGAVEIGKPLFLYGIAWEDYQDLQKYLGADSKLVRVSFSRGILEIMPTSTEHEYYARLIERFINVIALRTRQRITFFGSATMEKDEKRKGAEPDACFFVQRADLVSGNIRFSIAETPPDVVVEIDVHHASGEKFEIYAAFGVPEFWLYDEKALQIYELKEGKYEAVEQSAALPVLTAAVLTEFLSRSQIEDQSDVVFEFDKWLARQIKQN